MTTISGGKELFEMLKSLSEPCDCEDCEKERVHSANDSVALRSQDIQARILLDSYTKLIEPLVKKPGTLLVLKKGLFSGYKFSEGAVFIVSRVFDPPLRSDDKHGTNHFGREMDIAVLSISKCDAYGENIVEFAVDSRFFEPYVGEIA